MDSRFPDVSATWNQVGAMVVSPLVLAIISRTLLLASELVTLCHAMLIT